jgi:hypothetical protein
LKLAQHFNAGLIGKQHYLKSRKGRPKLFRPISPPLLAQFLSLKLCRLFCYNVRDAFCKKPTQTTQASRAMNLSNVENSRFVDQKTLRKTKTDAGGTPYRGKIAILTPTNYSIIALKPMIIHDLKK